MLLTSISCLIVYTR